MFMIKYGVYVLAVFPQLHVTLKTLLFGNPDQHEFINRDTDTRAVIIKFRFTSSLDLHTHNKLVTLWVNCINY